MEPTSDEPASAESERAFSTLLEFAPDSIVVHRDLTIVYINPAGATMLGAKAPRELLGRHLLDFTHPDYHHLVKKRVSSLGARQIEQVPLMRQKLRRLDGSDVDIEVASASFVYRGEPAVLTIARDISDRRRLEEELRQAQKMEAVGQLTSGIAHDFKNILSIILTTAEYLSSVVPGNDAEAQAGMDDLRSAARRGAEMIKRLMAFSRRAEMHAVPLDLVTVVRDAYDLLRRLMPENVEVKLDVIEGLRLVQADMAAVEQIVLNLATNSRDAMPNGGALTIGVTKVSLAAPQPTATGPIGPGAFACITVSDSGSGMDEQTLLKVFEPFFTTKPTGKGTGLGMAMVHGLTTQLGGAISIASRLGKGTTTTIYLPFAEGRGRRTMSTADMIATPAAQAAPRGGTERILVVEDEEPLRRASKRVLERLGYTVLLAENGESALELLRQRTHDVRLVISDTVMPKLDGFELYQAVREELPELRFMFATGYQVSDLVQRGIPEDLPFIAKPWTFDEFAAKVRQVLDTDWGVL